MNLVEQYTYELLAPVLRRAGISDAAAHLVTSDVEGRFLRAFAAQDDDRLALLEFSREEASHYQPAVVDLEIRMLVNACLRNSMLEDVHADSAYTPELRPFQGKVSEAMIRHLTTESARFFRKHWQERPAPGNGPACDLASRFPVAYRAICEAARLPHGRCEYQRVAEPLPDRPATGDSQTRTSGGDAMSAFDPRVSGQLQEVLLHCIASGTPFFTPSFKHISRNIDKVYLVIEQLLAHDVPVVTPNYLLSDGLVLKRKRLLKPIHNNSELKRQLRDRSGLDAEHRDYLEAIRAQLGPA